MKFQHTCTLMRAYERHRIQFDSSRLVHIHKQSVFAANLKHIYKLAVVLASSLPHKISFSSILVARYHTRLFLVRQVWHWFDIWFISMWENHSFSWDTFLIEICWPQLNLFVQFSWINQRIDSWVNVWLTVIVGVTKNKPKIVPSNKNYCALIE